MEIDRLIAALNQEMEFSAEDIADTICLALQINPSSSVLTDNQPLLDTQNQLSSDEKKSKPEEKKSSEGDRNNDTNEDKNNDDNEVYDVPNKMGNHNTFCAIVPYEIFGKKKEHSQ